MDPPPGAQRRAARNQAHPELMLSTAFANLVDQALSLGTLPAASNAA